MSGEYAADEVRDLLRRIHVYLGKEHVHSEGQTFHEGHPGVLLIEAAGVMEDMAIHLGLWGAPRTASRPAKPGRPTNPWEAPRKPQERAQEVQDSTVLGIAVAMSIADSSPPPAEPPSSPDTGGAAGGDFSGGGGSSDGGGASGDF